MDSTRTKQRTMALPVGALGALHRALSAEAGPLAASQSLQAAGYETGQDLYDQYERALGRDPRSVGEERFFRSLSDFLREHGWGSLRHSAPHPGVGLLTSSDWAEATDGADDAPASCAFSAGLLSGIITRAARGPVAVLQVTCRSRGDDSCGFAFGSEATMHELYALLLDGRALEGALGEL